MRPQTPLDQLNSALTAFRKGNNEVVMQYLSLYRLDGRGCRCLDKAALLLTLASDLTRRGRPELAADPYNEARKIVVKHLMQRQIYFARCVVTGAKTAGGAG
jgi:hypothetical protein